MKSKKRVSRSRSSVLFHFFKFKSHQDGTRKKITKENEKNFIFFIIQYKNKTKITTYQYHHHHQLFLLLHYFNYLHLPPLK